MSRPRLIETEKFLGCRDRDSSRLRNLLDVETETHRDLEISQMSRPRLIETGKFAGCRDRDQSRLDKRCRYRDSIETLVDLCSCWRRWLQWCSFHRIQVDSPALNKFLITFQSCIKMERLTELLILLDQHYQ